MRSRLHRGRRNRSENTAAAGLGLIDVDRLSHIPPRLRAQHEFCFHLHDSMLSMFLELASHRYPTIRIDLGSEDELHRLQAAGDPITYFLEADRKVAKDLSVGQAMMAVLSDYFNFIYEGLIALEKRKLNRGWPKIVRWHPWPYRLGYLRVRTAT